MIEVRSDEFNLGLGEVGKDIVGQFGGVGPVTHRENHLGTRVVLPRLINLQIAVLQLPQMLEGDGQVQAALAALVEGFGQLRHDEQ